MKSCLPYIGIIVLMGLTCLGLYFGVDVSLVDRPGVRMVIPARAGAWVGHEIRYCHSPACGQEFMLGDLADPRACPGCGEPLHTMTRVESEQLPPDTEFVKGRYTNSVGDTLFAAVVLSGRERSSIHRPQRCLVGQGNTIVGSKVLRVPIAGRSPLSVMVLDLQRHGPGPDGRAYEQTVSYAYWFVGQGKETPYHLERMFWLGWDRLVHSVAHKWSYVAVMGEKKDDDSYEAIRKIIDFIGAFYPQIRMDGES